MRTMTYIGVQGARNNVRTLSPGLSVQVPATGYRWRKTSPFLKNKNR